MALGIDPLTFYNRALRAARLSHYPKPSVIHLLRNSGLKLGFSFPWSQLNKLRVNSFTI
jgi:hypothetical protein